MIKLKDDTHDDLKALATYDDTMDDVVKRLIKFYKEKAKKN